MIEGTPLPTVRSDLVIRPSGKGSYYVIKDPATGRFFELGEQEHFLLQRLGEHDSRQQICTDFQRTFDEPLSDDDLKGFVALAEKRGFLQPRNLDRPDRIEAPSERLTGDGAPNHTQAEEANVRATAPRSNRRTNLLYMRWSLCDPDRLFDRLAPKLGFFWTSAFVATATVSLNLSDQQQEEILAICKQSIDSLDDPLCITNP